MFVVEENNILDKETCDNIIKRFDEDTRSKSGTINNGQINLDVKRSLDLKISIYEDWKDTNDILNEKIGGFINNYLKKLNDINHKLKPYFSNSIYDDGYQIQKTKVGEFFDWHDDNNIVNTYISNADARILTYIVYLNDVDEGGETEFIDGTKVKPKAGKGMIFPPHWTYLHRGVAPISNDKYICTGWVFCKTRPY